MLLFAINTTKQDQMCIYFFSDEHFLFRSRALHIFLLFLGIISLFCKEFLYLIRIIFTNGIAVFILKLLTEAHF